MFTLVFRRITENKMSQKLHANLMSGVADPAIDPDGASSLREETRKAKSPLVTILDRLEAGNLSIPEVCALANRGRTGFYEDLNAGLVTIRKIGRKSVVPGPIAKRYIAGEPLSSHGEAA